MGCPKTPSRASRGSSPGRAFLALAVCCGTTAPAQIFTADAGVASPELPSVRELVTTLHASNLDQLRLMTDLTYSPRTDLELRLRVPVVWQDVDFTDSMGARADGGLSGLGDVQLRAKYALLREDAVMRSNRLSLLGSVVFPTGEDDAALDGVAVPPRLQLGLGSFGLGLGPVYTIVRDRHRASVELVYQYWTSHDGYRPGDALYANAAYWFRLSPVSFDADEKRAEFRLVSEVLSGYRFSDRLTGTSVGNEGTEVWGVLGLQVNLSSSTRFEIGAQVPLYQDVDDALGTRKFGTVFSFKLYF